MNSAETALAIVALSFMESLIMELRERGLLDEAQLDAILSDVVDAHSLAAEDSSGEAAVIHRKVAMLARYLGDSGNSVRIVERLLEDPELAS